jgi:hypothetical protein
VARRLTLTLVLVAATLAVVPPVLGAVQRRSVPFGSAAFVLGALTMTRSGSGAILGGRALVPGSVVNGAVTIGNGPVAAQYRLSSSVSGDAAFARSLRVTVTRASDGSRLYGGPLAGLDADLGRLAPNAAVTYRLAVSLPRSAGNALQGRSASAAFSWSAVQN